MNAKPKSRRATFVRNKKRKSVEEQSELNFEIPRGSKEEIRYLIEKALATSTTEISNRLNEDGYPCASADQWTANLVDSALRRQDMIDLKERLKQNRGDTEGIGPSLLEIKQAAFDGAKEAVNNTKEIKLDFLALKTAVTDSVQSGLKNHHRAVDQTGDDVVEAIADQVKKQVERALKESDLRELAQVAKATSKNVWDIAKKLEDSCTELHDTVLDSSKSYGKKVFDAIEPFVHEVYAQIDTRFDQMESKIANKLAEGICTDIDDVVARVVDARLKAHLDEAMNRFAIMIQSLKNNQKGKR